MQELLDGNVEDTADSEASKFDAAVNVQTHFEVYGTSSYSF
jgi:hypothetical protein